MRPVLIALLVASCVRDEPRPVPQVRAPSPPVVVAAPPVTVAPAPAPAALSAPLPAALPTALPSSSEAPAVAAADPREATRKAAHAVLAKYCGECHEGHRSKNAKALAVYDLDKPDWPSRFDERISEGALRRLKSDEAREAFVAFRDAERAAAPKK
jgi:mono/diheme cytochrome c family protein